MKKIDVISSLIIGELTAWLAVSVIKNLMPSFTYTWVLPVAFPFIFLFGLWLAFQIGRKIPLIWQAAKFLMVGVLNTLVDLGVLNFLMFVSGQSSGMPFQIFKTVSFLFAVINSYFWNKFWAFKKENEGKIEVKSGKEVLQFFIVSIIGWAINFGISYLVVNIVKPQFGISDKLWANIGAVSATGGNMIWNFIGYKFIVFRQKPDYGS